MYCSAAARGARGYFFRLKKLTSCTTTVNHRANVISALQLLMWVTVSS